MHNGPVYDEWGIAHGYHDVDGNWHDTPPATREHLRAAMGEPPSSSPLWFVDAGSSHSLQGRCRLTLEDGSDWGDVDWLSPEVPLGYHRLAPLDGGPVTRLIVAPARCLPAPRGWGVAAQVYSLWGADDWGIGDLRNVVELGQAVGSLGGTAMLLSPLHSPAPTFPQEDSPYYPSSRRWLNPLLIPVDAPSPVPNEAGALIDRNAVWAAKRAALADQFVLADAAGEWRAWAEAQGDDLWRFCTWNALAERLGPRWQEWPPEFRRPGSDGIGQLLAGDPQLRATRDFHAWLQWRAMQSVASAATAAGVGLIGDLAVGCSPDGADAWLHQDLMALDVRIGAPPDPFNAAGQEWGLPPFVPARLRAAGYAPFIGMVRAACRDMAGLRIDHVMGLFRQFWIPAGGSPADGAYVQLPSADLLAIIRLEAARAGVFVVGEDLGTVEPEVHHALRSSGILGTKVWWFDPHPADWPEENLATVTTHDLPTVAGVWAATDGTPEMVAMLRAATAHDGVEATDAAAAAIDLHTQVAASPAVLCLAAVDDLAGCVERPNHPGTLADEQPNWRRRLPVAAEGLVAAAPGSAIVQAIMATERAN
ncbi:MAG: 4-alpha-glucanotransferase [Ilumatobacteraceae bacterium]